MAGKIVPFSKVRVGQRFTWIPKAWYGSCKLLEKRRRVEIEGFVFVRSHYETRRVVLFDIKFNAAVVNPPGVEYGVPSTRKVRLLKPEKNMTGGKHDRMDKIEMYSREFPESQK